MKLPKVNYMAETIKAKCDFVKELSTDPEMTRELCAQISICEELVCPLTETQIKEYVCLTVQGMLRKVHTHKFA